VDRGRGGGAAARACVLEPLGDVVRLTITETHAEPVDESYLEGGRTAWPVIASELTRVETGQPMPRFLTTW
jgi:hypothetical protein